MGLKQNGHTQPDTDISTTVSGYIYEADKCEYDVFTTNHQLGVISSSQAVGGCANQIHQTYSKKSVSRWLCNQIYQTYSIILLVIGMRICCRIEDACNDWHLHMQVRSVESILSGDLCIQVTYIVCNSLPRYTMIKFHATYTSLSFLLAKYRTNL